jgi:hypothetical protein
MQRCEVAQGLKPGVRCAGMGAKGEADSSERLGGRMSTDGALET